ncbi:MAG: PKD domain-containing protein [Thermotogota bacterium]
MKKYRGLFLLAGLLLCSGLLYGCSLLSAAPVADFDVSPVVLYAGEDVTLDASVSSGDIVDCAWTLGSGVKESGEKITTSFAAPGVYPVELTVTDGEGRTDTVLQELTVYARTGTRLFSEDFSDGLAALGRWALDSTAAIEDEGGIDYLSSDGVGYCLYIHSAADRLHRRGAAVEVPPLRVGQRLVFSFEVMTTKSHAGYGFVIAPGRSRFDLPAAGLPYFVYSGTSGGASIHEPSPDGSDAVLPVSFKPAVYQWHRYILSYSTDACTLAVDGEVRYMGTGGANLSTGGSWWIIVGDESDTDACSTYYGAMSATVEE